MQESSLAKANLIYGNLNQMQSKEKLLKSLEYNKIKDVVIFKMDDLQHLIFSIPRKRQFIQFFASS